MSPSRQGSDPLVGFGPDLRSSPFLDLLGGLQQRTTRTEHGVTISIGLTAASQHCNSRGTVHGGVLSALLDVALGRNAAASFEPPAMLTTVSLTTHFMSAARAGQWLQADAHVTRRGSSLCFAHGTLAAEGQVITEATAVFRVPQSS